MLWVLFIMTASGGVFVIGSYKTYAEQFQYGRDDKYLALVASLISVFNCSGRLVQGSISDSAGFRIVLR